MGAVVASQRGGVGALLREWRRRRRLSQLELGLAAGVSARHVSFLETGRARPSPGMVLQLAAELDVPLRERNRMLLAAGYAARFEQRGLDEPGMEPVRAAIEQLLAAHEPYPAVVIDGAWELLAANAAVGLLTEGVRADLLEPPLNVLRASLHPAGMAPRIRNVDQWSAHLLARLERQIALTGDPALAALHDEMRGYAPPRDRGRGRHEAGEEIAVPLRLATELGELALISTVATFGTAVEITASELSIESFFPADRRTAEALRSYAARLPAG